MDTRSYSNAEDSEHDFSTIAKKIVGRYIKSAVLIDDDWPSKLTEISAHHQLQAPSLSQFSSTGISEVATSKVNQEVLVDLEEECEDDSSDDTKTSDEDPDFPSIPGIRSIPANYVENPNADRLLKIQESFIRKGIICTGFKYTSKEKELAPLLAKNADILILDWNFGSDEGAGAIGILKELSKDGQLRFVCIFTDQVDLADIKSRIYADLFDMEKLPNESFDFKVENFVFTLRNKSMPGIDAKHKSAADDLFDDAVSHIAENYGGFLQLSMLEMTSRHRNTMLTHLTRFSPEFDAAIFSDSSQENSPAQLSENLRALLLDEWRIALETNSGSPEMWTLEESGRKAYAISLEKNLTLVTHKFLATCMTAMGIVDAEKTSAAFFKKESEKSLQTVFQRTVTDWLRDGANRNVPLEISKKNASKLTVAVLYVLSHPEKVNEAITSKMVWHDVLRLDALFSQQQILPTALTQGTILKYDNDSYFICITPLCDTVRLKPGYHAFTFLAASRAKPEEILSLSPDYCVFVENGEPICLHVEIKRPYTFEFNETGRKISADKSYQINARHRLLPDPIRAIIDREGVADLNNSSNNYAANHQLAFDEGARSVFIPFTVCGQLRGDFSFMLTAASASNGSRVGVNRVEFIRAAKVSKS